MRWLRSYVGPKLNTPSGAPERGYYFYIDNTLYKHSTELDTPLNQLTETTIIGERSAHIFEDEQGNIVEQDCTREEYDALAEPNAGAPQ